MTSLKIILILLGALVLVGGSGVAYYKYANAKMDLMEQNLKTAEANTKALQESFNDLQKRQEQAQAEYYALRDELTVVKKEAADLRKKIGTLNPPKPTPGGSNRQELEDTANQLLDDIFNQYNTVSGGPL